MFRNGTLDFSHFNSYVACGTQSYKIFKLIGEIDSFRGVVSSRINMVDLSSWLSAILTSVMVSGKACSTLPNPVCPPVVTGYTTMPIRIILPYHSWTIKGLCALASNLWLKYNSLFISMVLYSRNRNIELSRNRFWSTKWIKDHYGIHQAWGGRIMRNSTAHRVETTLARTKLLFFMRCKQITTLLTRNFLPNLSRIGAFAGTKLKFMTLCNSRLVDPFGNYFFTDDTGEGFVKTGRFWSHTASLVSAARHILGAPPSVWRLSVSDQLTLAQEGLYHMKVSANV